MGSNKTVFFITGILVVILGISMMIPYGVQLVYSENDNSFLSSSIVTIFIGILIILINLKKDNQLNLQQAFLFSVLAWVSIAIFGSLPFMLSSLNLSFSDAFFESMSGITTTGSVSYTHLTLPTKA